MTLLELRSIIAIIGLGEPCGAFDIDREKAEKEAIELLDRLTEEKGWFVQLGGWFALDSWLGYVRVGHRRFWIKRWLSKTTTATPEEGE